MSDAVAAPKYYVASNRVGAKLLWAFPLVGGGLAVLLGLVYAFLAVLITTVFEEGGWFIVVTPFFGAGLALSGRAVCYLGEVRRASLRLPILLAVGVLGYYASWHFYLVLFDTPNVFDPAPTWTMSPAALGHALVQLAKAQGVLQALSWLLELATIFGMIVYLQESDEESELPFCESCGKWVDQVFKLELAEDAAVAAAEHLRRGEAAAVGKLRRRPPATDRYSLVRVYRCPCGVSRFVCVHLAWIEKGKSGGLKYSSVTPGARKHVWVDPGSPDETHYRGLLENLVIDEATETALEASKS